MKLDKKYLRTQSPRGESSETVQHAGSVKRAGPMSVGRALRILEGLAAGPMALAELAREMDAPKPSLLGVLGELITLGYVRRDGAGRYLLSGRSYRLASILSASGSLSRSVRSLLAGLSAELEAAVSLGYLDSQSRSLVYVDRYGESSAVRYVVKFGAPIYLHTRATAKLLVAFEREETWPSWFGPEPYKSLTSSSRTTYKELHQELTQIRKDGVAWTVSEQYDGISGCAVPVFGPRNEAVAGIGMVMIGESLEKNRERVVAVLNEAAQSLSAEFIMRGISRSTLPLHV